MQSRLSTPESGIRTITTITCAGCLTAEASSRCQPPIALRGQESRPESGREPDRPGGVRESARQERHACRGMMCSAANPSACTPKQPEGEGLVEQNLHDACRTVGGRCAEPAIPLSAPNGTLREVAILSSFAHDWLALIVRLAIHRSSPLRRIRTMPLFELKISLLLP
jgi:hypothetical protein